jgi:transcriptional regulator with XRE-family HTH domain
MPQSYTVDHIVSTNVVTENMGMRETATYGTWLKRTRKARGVSQERLSELATIDRGHLSRIENNRIDLPQWETRQKIHQVLETTDEELVAAGILDAVYTGVGAEQYPAPTLRVLRAVEDLRAEAIALIPRLNADDLEYVLMGIKRLVGPPR